LQKQGEPALPLVWQWNHNPDNRLWSVTKRKGWLRLCTGLIDTSILNARNMLTQRTFGPTCSFSTMLDLSHMREGDKAGLCLLQKNFGYVGVKKEGGLLQLIVVNTENGQSVEYSVLTLRKQKIWLRADCDFRNMTDTARFYFSTNGKTWNQAGAPLKMKYTLPHFMGYRAGLFNYATKEVGGWVDVDGGRWEG